MTMLRFVRLLVAALLTGLMVLAAGCGDSDGADNAASDGGGADSAGDADGSAPDTESPGDQTISDDSSTSDESADTTTSTAAAPAPLALIDDGPYAVGVKTIEVTDGGRDRPLTVDVWFPLADDTSGDPHRYSLLPGVYYESPDAISAEPDALAADGPFPLVVYSHGSGGLRYIHSSYTEAIASHGYVVMAPDHTGNTAVERLADNADPREVIAANRPLDIRVVIDAALAAEHPTAGAFTPAIDAENIAVTGHSFGGYTAYAVAGGVTVDGTEIEADPRVDALVPLAPATGDTLLSDEQLSGVSVPTMIIVGTDDKTTPIDPNVERPWELSPASPHYRVELSAAEHQTFTDLCAYQDFLPTLEGVPDVVSGTIEEMGEEGCSSDDMPIDRATELTNTLAIGFLNAVLREGPALDPAAVTLPDDVTIQLK